MIMTLQLLRLKISIPHLNKLKNNNQLKNIKMQKIIKILMLIIKMNFKEKKLKNKILMMMDNKFKLKNKISNNLTTVNVN